MQRPESLIFVLFLGIIVGCTGNESSQQTLMLSLSSADGTYRISDYQVMDSSFKKSNQQGNFQAHLLNPEGKKLREISFQQIETSHETADPSALNVLLPLVEDLDQVAIYQLDGSSGHYQLPEDPLVTWELPDSLKAKIKSVK